MALSFTSNNEKMAFLKSDNFSRMVKAVAPQLEFNILGIDSFGTGGIVTRDLKFSDLPALVAWCQNATNIATLTAFLSNPSNPQSRLFNWTGSAVDLANDLGAMSGEQEGFIIGSDAFGTGWVGSPVWTDEYWLAHGSPPAQPHGTAAVLAGDAFVGILAMTIANTNWSYSAGSWYWVPGLFSTYIFDPQYKPLVPSTNVPAAQWVLMPMPDYDTSIFNNTPIPAGSSPSQYLVDGLMSLPVVPLLPGLDHAG